MIRPHSLLISLLVILIFATCRPYADELDAVLPAEGELQLLTYNVAGLPEVISQSQPSHLTSKIGRLLNDYDIVHVQEDFNYNHFLYAAAEHPFRSPWSGPAIFGDGLNVLSKFPIKNFVRMRWDDCHGTDCLTPKGFTFCQILVAPGVSIDFYDVHCNAGDAELDLAARRKNILQLAAYIDTHSAGHAVVVMGDMNCRYTRTGDNIREILGIGFKDAWVELKREGRLPAQDGNSLMDCTTDPSISSCEVVDKMFYRSNDKIQLTALEQEMQEEKFSEDGQWLSDHMPLFVRMKYSFQP